jgi:phospholipid-binding lipoprotein MlaA
MAVLVLSGCASMSGAERDPRDPIEPFNRAMYRFNDVMDKALITPIAKGYRAITPAPVDTGITNFFGNLGDVGSAVNSLLQFKLKQAASDIGRVLVNSTVGVLGFFDVASKMNLEKHGEDFGQTLGAWGVGPGPYIVWPLIGPSSGRDSVGMVGDWFTDPVNYVEHVPTRNTLRGVRAIDKRADLLGASRVMEEAALDEYELARDAYLQKRENDVHDGNPPDSGWESDGME